MAAHHMIQVNGADHQLYKERMIQLQPILERLQSSGSKVLWFHQYPTVEFYGSIKSYNTDVYSLKLHNYNNIARNLLKYVFFY